MRFVLLIVSFVFVLFLSPALTDWERAAIGIFVFAFLQFIADLGKKIVILDLTIIMLCLTCLLMPVIFYHVYTIANPLAKLWLKYMPIPTDSYFSFAVPGCVALILGIRLPIRKNKYDNSPQNYIENVKTYLKKSENSMAGLYLVAIGVAAGLLDFLAPGGLKEVFFLMAHLVFVGVFYVIYSPNKNKRYIVPGVLLLMIGECVATGMFGHFIFILACSIVLVLLGSKVSFATKLSYALLGLFVIVMLQSIKSDYRKRTWQEEGGQADPTYFVELIGDRLSDPSKLLDPNGMFILSVRMNQGWLVANTIRLVPDKHPFGDGEPLLEAVAATFVPRALWPDKPEAGGRANLKRFWGFDLVGWSTNLGTLGEAYANFDRIGGIFYMFFYGLFFNIMLTAIIKRSEKHPTMILWLPYLFFTAIAVETDLLTTLGALIKGIVFAWITFRAFQYFFRMQL